MERPHLRAVFVGPEDVGKTCLIRHISTDEFLGDGLTLPSIGANFVSTEVIATNGHRVTIGLWDTPGQTSYRDLMIPPLRNADFVVLVFDLTDMRTFVNLRRSYEKAKFVAPTRAQFFLFGKCDLDDPRAVVIDDIQDYADSLHAAGLLEAPAKTGGGIHVFRAMLTDAAGASRDRVESIPITRHMPKEAECQC
jgi:small GTP-binding protein